MKKINFARIIWILCLFILLITILIMVMDYKIHYQYLTANKLYFYDCSGNLCVTEVKDDTNLMFSSYDCGYEECPVYKKNIADSYVLLEQNKKFILYDYRKAKVISQEYEDYQFLTENYIIVTIGEKYGVIDLDNNLTVAVSYNKLGYNKDDYLMGYTLNNILAKKGEKYGIISYKDGSIVEDFQYKEEEIPQLLEKLKEN